MTIIIFWFICKIHFSKILFVLKRRDLQLYEVWERDVKKIIDEKFLYIFYAVQFLGVLYQTTDCIAYTWCIWIMIWWLLWFQSLEASNNAFHGARTKLVSKSIYVYKTCKLVNLYLISIECHPCYFSSRLGFISFCHINVIAGQNFILACQLDNTD